MINGCLVAGCQEKTSSPYPAVPSLGAGPAPTTPVSKTTAQAAPDPDERFQRQHEVAVVVDSFLQAVQREDWAKAAKFVSTEFRRTHEKELLDGSLLHYDPHAGKTVQSILHYPGACVGRVAIRGDRAWAEVQAGCSPWSQAGMTALELVRKDDQWKLLRFPSPRGTIDVLMAGYDGEAAGRWFKSMLSDGEFTEEEQAEIRQVLDAYYAVVVQMQSNVEGRPLPPPDYRPATIDWLREIAQRVKDAESKFSVANVAFWPKPSEDVVCIGEALAKQAIRQIYEDLAAAKDKYPELGKFDEEHVSFSEGELRYDPGLSPQQGYDGYRFLISVSICTPHLGPAKTSPRRIILPRQKLAVYRHAMVSDSQLTELVKETIEKNLEPLIRFEKLLGGEPVYDNW